MALYLLHTDAELFGGPSRACNGSQLLHLWSLTAIIGTAWEDKWPKDIAIATAREPAHASTFNYASMAHNNHFFFDGLSPHKTEMPKELEKSLIRSFSSLETLRREFIITVNAMFGPGFVWLVYKTPEASQAFQSRTSEYALLTTYLAGSPYPAAHWRRQSTDMNTENEPPVNTVGAMGKHSMSSKIKQPAPGGFRSPNSIVPLLCINTWEHVWLPDYGVGGKWAYTENWWERINWEKVHENNQPTELLK